jgi:hypothetical protein
MYHVLFFLQTRFGQANITTFAFNSSWSDTILSQQAAGWSWKKLILS